MERVALDKAAESFGGFSELARLLGVPISTCHGWHQRERVPPWRMKALEELARTNKIKLKYIRSRKARRKSA
jgi:hypothetical protein